MHTIYFFVFLFKLKMIGNMIVCNICIYILASACNFLRVAFRIKTNLLELSNVFYCLVQWEVKLYHSFIRSSFSFFRNLMVMSRGSCFAPEYYNGNHSNLIKIHDLILHVAYTNKHHHHLFRQKTTAGHRPK